MPSYMKVKGPGVQLRDSGCLLKNFVSEELTSQMISPQASHQFQGLKNPLKKNTSTTQVVPSLVGLQNHMEVVHQNQFTSVGPS